MNQTRFRRICKTEHRSKFKSGFSDLEGRPERLVSQFSSTEVGRKWRTGPPVGWLVRGGMSLISALPKGFILLFLFCCLLPLRLRPRVSSLCRLAAALSLSLCVCGCVVLCVGCGWVAVRCPSWGKAGISLFDRSPPKTRLSNPTWLAQATSW